MAKMDASIEAKVIKLYIIFPVAVWREVGCIAVLTVLGIRVYRRQGDARCLLGFTWSIENAA